MTDSQKIKMNCSHLKRKTPPSISSVVYREECTLCFDSQDSETGLNVCLDCYNGGCINQGHSALHFEKSGHALVVNIKRIRVGKEGESRPQKITKLSIQETNPDEEFEFQTTLKCVQCGDLDPEKAAAADLDKVADAILKAVSAKKKSELKAWEEESLQTCYHTSELVQQTHSTVLGSDLAHCSSCDLKENLWLCLTCGNLGCGRAQFGGLGGNGHGLAHYEASKHPVSVKMGSITPEGTADIFCYEHGTEILNPELEKHLATFGINIETQEKTVKTIAELQLEQNLKFDFSMTTEDGTELTPLSGPGLTGMVNLGNSCYMASVLQTIFSIPSFKDRYYQSLHSHQCYDSPADCFQCQMGKLADGLLSGRYASSPQKTFGVTPSMFKTLIGKGHPEFSTMRQQDAQEFLEHILSTVEQKERSSGQDPSSSFRFLAEQRKQCLECEHVHYASIDTSCLMLRIPAVPLDELVDGKVQYKDVSLQDCIDTYFGSDIREFSCPIDKQTTTASFTQNFHTYPEFLVCVAARFVLGKGWVMEKLNVNINAPLTLSLDSLRATGHQQGEKLFPAETETAGGSEPPIDQDALAQLIGMGFSENRSKRAIITTGNTGAEVAMQWIFDHMDDAGIDDPLPFSGGAPALSDAELGPLMDMGFTKKQALLAMKETGNNMERAVDWLFNHPDAGSGADPSPSSSNGNKPAIDRRPASYELFALISHKGTSAHCGHYVSFIQRGEAGASKWVLFNDNKVVEVPDMTENIKQAYLYIYRRV